jgi:hypothetical protein
MTVAPRIRPPAAVHRLLRCVLLVGFVWLAGRHWHPYYGFTRFLQMDVASAAATVPELRNAPIFLYDDGYDGHYYAQLAARPAVNDPVLAGSIDNVGYRARRILMSWLAWAAGGGNPVPAVRAYAMLNLFWWGALAALLWRVFPCTGWRETMAWTGMLFSAGVLHSVRLSLTDLLALLLVASAVVLAGRERRGSAAASLALGGLARETALLATVMLFPTHRRPAGAWYRAVGAAVLVALPLLGWILYLRLIAGWGGGEPTNFAFPLSGWWTKWSEVFSRLRTEPDHWLAITTLLAQVAISAQMTYLLLRRQPLNPWWRLGMIYIALLAVLGTVVWEGNPGAATRVLLPLALAFNGLAVATRAGAAWLVAGNLSVFAGVQVLWTVPQSTHEIAAGSAHGSAYVVHTDRNWYPAEYSRRQIWAWTQSGGALHIDFLPSVTAPVAFQLQVKGMTPRALEIRSDGRMLWSGHLTGKMQTIVLPPLAVRPTGTTLELRSPAPGVKEGPRETDRTLGFAVYGLRVD